VTRAKLWTPAFILVVVLQFTLVIVNGSTTMAMPAIKEGLGATNSNIQWFAALFALGFALVLVMSGRLGDLYGTKRLLLIGFAALLLAMTFEALSPNIYLLLVARLLQGVAGGITAPQLSAMIQRTFDGHERTRAFSVFLMVSAGGFMAGPLSAGALISSVVFGLGWRWAFLPFVPIGFVLWFFAARLLPHTPPGVAGRLDITGAAVLGVVSFLVMFPLLQGRNAGWPIWIFVMLACAVPVFIAFVTFARRFVASGGSPLIDPSLFKIPTFNAGNIITLLVGTVGVGGAALHHPHHPDRFRTQRTAGGTVDLPGAVRQHVRLVGHCASAAPFRARCDRLRRTVLRLVGSRDPHRRSRRHRFD